MALTQCPTTSLQLDIHLLFASHSLVFTLRVVYYMANTEHQNNK